MYNKLPLWPITQKFKFNKYKKKADKHKIDYIKNFFKKKYNSKYCVLTSSARVGIILALKYKKFDRSKIFNIPVWSSHCLYNSIGYLQTNDPCVNNPKIKSLVSNRSNVNKYRRVGNSSRGVYRL